MKKNNNRERRWIEDDLSQSSVVKKRKEKIKSFERNDKFSIFKTKLEKVFTYLFI